MLSMRFDAASFCRRLCRRRFPGLVPGKRVCGPSRLPDVKPPCSNLAGTSFRPFSCVLTCIDYVSLVETFARVRRPPGPQTRGDRGETLDLGPMSDATLPSRYTRAQGREPGRWL